MSTITNTITSPISLGTSGNYTSPLTITTTGVVSTSGRSIFAPFRVSPAWTIDNFGTITSSAQFDPTAYLVGYTTVVNSGTAALISGRYEALQFISQGYVNNSGTITANEAIFFDNGTIVNSGSKALINGIVGIFGRPGNSGNPVVISNSGTIQGSIYGVYLTNALNNTITNSGTISGGSAAILFGSGNDRVVVEPGATFVGNVDGGGGNNTLELASGISGTLSLSNGTISGIAGNFVYFNKVTADSGATSKITGTLASGGSLTLIGNNTIAGTLADLGALTNYGTLTGGVLFIDPGSMTNTGSVAITVTLDLGNTSTGVITVAGTAVYGTTNGPDTVANAGTIQGTGTAGAGVFLADGGTVTNSSSTALISGGKYGIKIAAATITDAGTVTNAGTISGGTDAVLFGGSDDRLIIKPGAKFVGYVDGGAGADTIELASASSTGTLSGVGTKYLHFETITVDSGAKWTLPGTVGGISLVANAGTIVSTNADGIRSTNAGARITNAGTGLISGYTGGIRSNGANGQQQRHDHGHGHCQWRQQRRNLPQRQRPNRFSQQLRHR